MNTPNSTLRTPNLLIPGVCQFCGCSADEPCPGGCGWADADRTVCTRCAEAVSLAASDELRAQVLTCIQWAPEAEALAIDCRGLVGVLGVDALTDGPAWVASAIQELVVMAMASLATQAEEEEEAGTI